MNVKLKGALASLVLLVTSNAHAVIEDGTTGNYGSDIFISILNTATQESALVDTNLNAVSLAASPSLFTLSDAAVTSFLGTGSAADYVFAVVGVQANNATTTGLDFGTLVSKAGSGNGPVDIAGLSSAITNIQGDINGANADPAYTAEIVTGLTDPTASITTDNGAFHTNVTKNAAANHGWNINGALDVPVEFAWTHFDLNAGAIITEILGYWSINSTSGQISFATTPSTVPVPAAVWLFGSGLLGLVGVARRRKA